MFKEVLPIQQGFPNTQKRWFTDREMDLFIWFHRGRPSRFLLSFDKPHSEQAIRWTTQGGLQFFRVDSGEKDDGRYKQSPLLLEPQQDFDVFGVARRFLANSEEIDPGIADFIYARLLEYPGTMAHRNETRQAPRVAQYNA